MHVPDRGVLTSSAGRISLYSLAEARPVALVFLRHLGCIFCRQYVASLRDELPDANVAFVTMASPEQADRFRRWLRSPHLFLCDPERKLYEAFDVPRAMAGSFFSRQVVRRALKAYREGHRNSLTFDDQLQLGGTYVMDRKGNVLASFAAQDISDSPSSETLRELLLERSPASSVSLA